MSYANAPRMSPLESISIIEVSSSLNLVGKKVYEIIQTQHSQINCGVLRNYYGTISTEARRVMSTPLPS